ncbi:hypothetical protein BD414DRAFT_468170 [Trametes punicea]|nr:hypothetical protein BD414DRAFT_468170 [Trametes punicea]
MSDYNDSGAYKDTPHNSFYPDSSQGRPPSGYPSSSGGRRAPRYSRATNPSWVSNGMLSPPPFAGPPSTAGSRPLPVPSPTPSRGVSEFRPQYPPPSDVDDAPESYRGPGHEPDPEEWEPETERMTIGQSADEHYDDLPYPGDQAQAAPQYDHGNQQAPRQDSFYDPIAPAEPEAKPKNKKTFVGGFVAGLRRLPKAMVKSHFYDRKATRKGAPGTELETGPSHYLPAYDDPGVTVADPASVHYVEAVEMPTGPRSPSQVSYADPTRPPSNAVSQRYSGQSNPQSATRPTSPRIVTTPTPMSPVLVTPHPASDYAKMDSPVRQAAPDDSFSAHVTRVKDFLHDLKHLPWTSSRVALDYIPTQGSRARVGKAKHAGSWYTGVRGHQEIDLLGSGRPTPRRLRSDGGASVRSGPHIAIAHDGRTPASFVTSPGLIPSPGMSSHGHGQHAMSYSYYFAPPQPLYVYQSPMTTPATNPAITDSPSSSQSTREPTQAVPVYMMAGPPPGLIPTPPPAAHPSTHNHATRASPNLPPPGLPVAQIPSHHSNANSH